MFTKDILPDSWRSSVTLFVPKSTPGKFRPISLNSCFLKILENLIFCRLDWWVEKEDLLPSFQFGFRKGKSCLNNLSLLATEIHTGFVLK